VTKRWRWVAGVVLVLVPTIAHRPLFRWTADVLVVEDRCQGTTAYAVFDGEHDKIAALYHADPHTMLLIATPPRRLEVAGLLPSRVVTNRKALEARGVPATAIQTIPSLSESTWDGARSLGDWLRDHPGDRIAVLCKRFNSRYDRLILDRAMGDTASWVDVIPLSDSRYDESNWWRRKEGAIAFQTGLTLLSYNWIAGEGERPTGTWDPDAYERTLP